MNLRALLVFAAAVVLGAIEAVSIDHDTVQPFAQPEPVTDSEKSAIRFKPGLRIVSGCYPYPAVNAAGETSSGLKGSGLSSNGCKGSSLGSQVYGRAVWYSDRWAIMYAWYFPKDKPSFIFKQGKRHDWVNVVVWIDNPSLQRPTLLGVSPGSTVEYHKYISTSREPLNTPTTIDYMADSEGFHWVDLSSKDGEFQDLIMWEQLTDEARRALNETYFGGESVPFIDANFLANLDKAWPF